MGESSAELQRIVGDLTRSILELADEMEQRPGTYADEVRIHPWWVEIRRRFGSQPILESQDMSQIDRSFLEIHGFPVLWPCQRAEIVELEALGCPRRVPWRLVERHEQAAQRNHSQTLMRLAQRGGLDVRELVTVLLDEPLSAILGRDHRPVAWAVAELHKILAAYSVAVPR